MTEVPPEGGSATAGLTVSGLEFAYGDDEPVLRDASLDVPAGRVRALLGPSGCGKTTLLRVVAGLERPRAGSVIGAGGRVLTDTASRTWVDPAERRVAMVFQNWALFPHMTVGGEHLVRDVAQARAHGGRLSETLAMVGLEGLGQRRPAELSGGQQQRVALGRALAQRPEVLLLDEPFSNLDPGLRARVREEVREAARITRHHDPAGDPRPRRGVLDGRPVDGAARRCGGGRRATGIAVPRTAGPMDRGVPRRGHLPAGRGPLRWSGRDGARGPEGHRSRTNPVCGTGDGDAASRSLGLSAARGRLPLGDPRDPAIPSVGVRPCRQ
ncbi:MAG: ATP-binding cassette domain-containing protein [Microthrixaceae bacterium]